jgi:WD40 repeat protein
MNSPKSNSAIYIAARDGAYLLAASRRAICDSEGARVITLGDRCLNRLDPRTWKCIASQSLEEAPNRIEAPRDLSRLYLGSKNAVSIYDPATFKQILRKIIVTPKDRTGFITCMAVSPEGRWLAVGLEDGTLKILRAPELKLERTIDGRIDDLRHVELTENAALVAVQIGSELKLYRRR